MKKDPGGGSSFQQAAVLATEPLLTLRDNVPPECFERLLRKIIDVCDQHDALIHTAIEAGNIIELTDLARDLANISAQAGLLRLETVAHALGEALFKRDAAQIQALALTIREASREGAAALRERFLKDNPAA